MKCRSDVEEAIGRRASVRDTLQMRTMGSDAWRGNHTTSQECEHEAVLTVRTCSIADEHNLKHSGQDMLRLPAFSGLCLPLVFGGWR